MTTDCIRVRRYISLVICLGNKITIPPSHASSIKNNSHEAAYRTDRQTLADPKASIMGKILGRIEATTTTTTTTETYYMLLYFTFAGFVSFVSPQFYGFGISFRNCKATGRMM